jgi:Ca-activated chloride channel family protein
MPQAKDSDALYNRGNALAKAQRYEDALKSYDQALAQAPGMEDAQFNRKAVEDWLRAAAGTAAGTAAATTTAAIG